MKKIILMVISLIIGFIGGIAYTINTMQVNITNETNTGAIVEIVILNQCFTHYCEK